MSTLTWNGGASYTRVNRYCLFMNKIVSSTFGRCGAQGPSPPPLLSDSVLKVAPAPPPNPLLALCLCNYRIIGGTLQNKYFIN